MGLLGTIIVFSLIGGVVSAISAIILFYREDWPQKTSLQLLSFAAGTLLGTSFLELLPEASEFFEAAGIEPTAVFTYTLIGLIFFFITEGVLFHLHHHHTSSFEEQPDEQEKHTVELLVAGDSLHNFIDGIVIGATFLIDVRLGITTTLAVAAHEIPQEIGDASVMIRAGWKKRRVLFWNIVPSLLTTLGAVLAYFYQSTLEAYLGYMLAFTAGFFIYIASSDLIPELYHSTRQKKMSTTFPAFFAGIFIIAILTRIIAE